MRGLVQEACRHLHRWETAKLTVSQEGGLLPFLISPAPQLHTLSVTSTGARISRGEEHVLDVFQGQAPRLKSISLTKFSVPWDSQMLSGLQELRLSRITAYSPSIRELLSILAASPQLVSLSLESIGFKHTQPFPTLPHVYLPLLQELDISSLQPRDLGLLLHSITSPPCRSLSISCTLGASTHDMEYFKTGLTPFISTSDTTDVKLTLGDDHVVCTNQAFFLIFIGEQARRALNNLTDFVLPPQLLALNTALVMEVYETWDDDCGGLMEKAGAMHVTSLTVEEMHEHGMDKILKLLARPRGGRWLLPALRDVAVGMKHGDIEGLYRMVKARHQESGEVALPTPLTSLSVWDASTLDDDYREGIEAIVGSQNVQWA